MKEICEKLLLYIINEENIIQGTDFYKFDKWQFDRLYKNLENYHCSMKILVKNVMYYKNIENNVIDELIQSNDIPNTIIAINLLYNLLNEK